MIRCEKCKKITERIGNDGNGNIIYGCKTPEKCGYKEYLDITNKEGGE